jgi:hypothetical protein
MLVRCGTMPIGAAPELSPTVHGIGRVMADDRAVRLHFHSGLCVTMPLQ